jgi:hypothetical protein
MFGTDVKGEKEGTLQIGFCDNYTEGNFVFTSCCFRLLEAVLTLTVLVGFICRLTVRTKLVKVRSKTQVSVFFHLSAFVGVQFITL